MLAASAVDAMMRAIGYVDGSLYSRINKAVDDHLITPDMGVWAHKVRLDANDPRHADAERPHITADDARRSVDFASSLGHILFVLPDQVTAGVKEASGMPTEEGGSLSADNE